MTGQEKIIYSELISPFLRKKMETLALDYGQTSREYQAIARQYVASNDEKHVYISRERSRHYFAEMHGEEKGLNLAGVERLYRRTVVLEPTTACLARCRWCLRSQYARRTLTPAEILEALRYFARDDQLREVLVTGGDPMIIPSLLEFILDGIEETVPLVQVVRIGSRILTQEPERVDKNLLAILKKTRRFRIEIGTHICHPIEFWSETVDSIHKLLDIGLRLYNQHPLLSGVNDSADVLIDLYDAMRNHDVDPHYMFHCIPLLGMDHHRTSIQKGLDLISVLDSGGHFSGRGKPHYAAMTDIGKVILYHGSILNRNKDENLVLLKTSYAYEDRMKWNPSWVKPASCEVDEHGYMTVWYPDGEDTPWQTNLILGPKGRL